MISTPFERKKPSIFDIEMNTFDRDNLFYELIKAKPGTIFIINDAPFRWIQVKEEE
jgi:hypothetical protein